MKNLEQVRARNALAYAAAEGRQTRGKEGGNVLKKLPALILSNGLLASGAFAFAQKPDSGWSTCFDHLAQHLADPEIKVCPDCKDLKTLMEYLSGKADSNTLKHATDEALAWLSYARRFEPRREGDNEPDGTK